jgi:hypothetical protein
VQFILGGDADGQRKPICDQWQEAMDVKDIRKSQFIWELCGGLRVKLNKYRRGIDQKLFNDYTSLYVWADLNVYVGDTRNWGLGEYGSLKKIDYCFVISHNKRIQANRAMVYCKALVAEGPLLFLPEPPGNHERMTLVPRALILWRGLDVVCYNKRYSKTSPVTGCVYTVMDFDDKTVTVQLHADYARKIRTPKPQKEPKKEPEKEPEKAAGKTIKGFPTFHR